MKLAIGADERTPTTDHLSQLLSQLGHEITLALGPMAGRDEQWADVGRGVAEAVASGDADNGIVCCWTGTGVTMAANKVRGARAALCTDAEQARGARKWNDANILGLSLRLTTPALCDEIVTAWFDQTDLDPGELPNIDKVKAADR